MALKAVLSSVFSPFPSPFGDDETQLLGPLRHRHCLMLLTRMRIEQTSLELHSALALTFLIGLYGRAFTTPFLFYDFQTKEQQARPSRDSPSVDADASNACESREDREFAGFSPWMERCRDTEDSLEFDSPLPLEVLVRRCVQVPVLAQCRAIDSAALAFLVRGAGVAEHLVSLRSFLLGHGSDFLQDFTSRLLEGLFDGW